MNLQCDIITSARELYSVGKYEQLISFLQRFLNNFPKYQLPINVALYSLQWFFNICNINQHYRITHSNFFLNLHQFVLCNNTIILSSETVLFCFLLVYWDKSNYKVINISIKVRCHFHFFFWNNKLLENLLIIIKAISLMLNLS